MITIGVISDTHGVLDCRVQQLFAGVDHIFHAGDIGAAFVLRDLEGIAPVTAVSGNCDCGVCPEETEVIVLGSFKFLLRHIFDPSSPGTEMRRLISSERPHAIVFGHSHRPCLQHWGNVLLFNPGYAGQNQGCRRRSVGLLSCDEGGIRAKHIDL